MLNIFGDFWSVSSTIAPEEKCPPTAKLILIKPLNLTRGLFSSKAIVCLPPNPKTKPNLDPNPNPNRGPIFLVGNCLDTFLSRH